MANIGFSFQPGSQDLRPGGGGGTPRPNGPQSAVEVRSFSLPNRTVPGQIAPAALLNSPGGGGSPEMDILRRLMQAFAPSGQQFGVPTLSPSPAPASGVPNFGPQPVPVPPNGPAPPYQVPHDPDQRRPPVQPLPNVVEPPGVPEQPEVPLEHGPGLPPVVVPGDLPHVEEPLDLSFQDPSVFQPYQRSPQMRDKVDYLAELQGLFD